MTVSRGGLLAPTAGLPIECRHCHRPLSDPTSRLRGAGPDCERKNNPGGALTHGRPRSSADPGVSAGQPVIPGLGEEET
jgi:hypothetical protein